MTTKQLERLADKMKPPKLKPEEVGKLLDREDYGFVLLAEDTPKQPVAQRVAQPVAQRVAQPVAQAVAQGSWVAQAVAQEVAQRLAPTVAQEVAQPVAQNQRVRPAKTQSVSARNRKSVPTAGANAPAPIPPTRQPMAAVRPEPKRTASTASNTQVDKDVDRFKEEIYQIASIEDRKRYCMTIGFKVVSERRGGQASYLYGVKKLEGKKYRLYIGNSASV